MSLAQQRLQAELRWWIAHESSMDYAQIRPVPLDQIKKHEHCKTDCSGSLYGIWHALGFPDPTGGAYTDHDIVYTGTLLTANEKIPNAGPSSLEVGDVVIFGTTESTAHVAAVLERGTDPLLFSHGQNAGPIEIRLSAEANWHRTHGHPIVSFRRTDLPADTKPRAPQWRVSIGNGTVIGKTRVPRLWTMRQRPFKGHDAVHYKKLSQ